MKKLTHTILYLFLLSIIVPSIESILTDVKKQEMVCEIDKTEKEIEKYEDNELDFFDKILFLDYLYFIKASQIKNEISSFIIFQTSSQFKQIYTPPPNFKF